MRFRYITTANLMGHESGPSASLPGGHSEWVPPESISNSEVKTLSADDSAGFPRVKVGHCQAYKHWPESPTK